jgi:hypothetical protein
MNRRLLAVGGALAAAVWTALAAAFALEMSFAYAALCATAVLASGAGFGAITIAGLNWAMRGER